MVSTMDLVETTPTHHNQSTQSAISQSSIDLQIPAGDRNSPSDLELIKRTMKLELKHHHNSRSKEEPVLEFVRSPKSPPTNTNHSGSAGCPSVITTGGARIITQSSITSQIDIVEDRKALRDALYQGIFSRHRRTIFAFGSFLRMLRSRNSQYNTIRSSSEGEDDGR